VLVKSSLEKIFVTFKGSDSVGEAGDTQQMSRVLRENLGRKDGGNRESVVMGLGSKPKEIFGTSLRKGYVLLYHFEQNLTQGGSGVAKFEYLRPSLNFSEKEDLFRLDCHSGTETGEFD
jgi:hypothetical protein